MKRSSFIFVLLCLVQIVRAAEVIPPAPKNHFNDYGNVVSAATAQQLNIELADFERQTSNQIIVAVFPKMESNSSISDYCTRVFTAWKPGQKGKDNGAILFVFVQDHKVWIQTGYGLEGALPDALCKRIIDQDITPRFRQQDYAGGLAAGINAMIAATRGEYKGTGSLVNEVVNKGISGLAVLVPIIIILILILMERSTVFARGGRRRQSWLWGPFFMGGYGGGWGGGGWGGGGSWGGGGGGGGGTFSGGGGSTGGGGAGGSW